MCKCLFTCTVLFVALTGFCQQSGFALRGGINAATFHQSPAFDYGTLLAGQAGVEIYVANKKGSALALSYLYTVKGNERKNSPTNVRTVLRYLQWDATYLKYVRFKKAALFAGGGLYLGYALNGRYKSDAGTSKVTFSGIGNSGTFDRLDLGFPFKLGVDNGKLIVGIDYDLGVWNILNTSSSGKLFNRNFSFYVSYPLHSR